MTHAQLDAGFSSASAFRAAFAKLLGQAPGHLKADAMLRADWIDTRLGAMLAVCDARALHLLEFIDRKALRPELAPAARRGAGQWRKLDCACHSLPSRFGCGWGADRLWRGFVAQTKID